MKTLILGLGVSGSAAYELLEREGEEVVGVEEGAPVAARATKRVEINPSLSQFDRVVVSPGIPPSHRLYREALSLGIPVIGEAELALSRFAGPAVAITGTNGKTTVTLLVEHVLSQCNIPARAVGNVGIPLSSYVSAKNEGVAIIELSSFQLETLHQVVFDAGVILNITPDHLDRYLSMEAYAAAKFRLQGLIKPEGDLWVHQTVVEEYRDFLGREFQTYNAPCQKSIVEELPQSYSTGEHEKDNLVAAYLLCSKFGVNKASFMKGVESFQKPPHRIEFVASLHGVDYINDSKGTNIDATIKAVAAMKGPVLLIAGGVDKRVSYLPWIPCFKGKVQCIIAIGEVADRIEKEVGSDLPVRKGATLRAAVRIARELAMEGDTVLLSPGSSSYDMFRDYVHRGDAFKEIVREVEG